MIKKTFENLKGKKAFMAHVYCGDPCIDFSRKLVDTLKDYIDILEFGIPFSDPIADGKIFQEACQHSLNAKITPAKVFDCVKDIRKSFDKTIVLTTYYNIIYQIGIDNFVEKLKENNIQGLIVPDLPLEESDELQKGCKDKDIHLIYLIAPTTTDERIKMILKKASGFVYLVSVAGVTGTGKKVSDDVKTIVEKIRKESSIPILIGFGISGKKDIEEMKELNPEGYIIGSEICRRYSMKGTEEEKLENVKKLCEEIKKVC